VASEFRWTTLAESRNRRNNLSPIFGGIAQLVERLVRKDVGAIMLTLRSCDLI
jgi:hypothetical protein